MDGICEKRGGQGAAIAGFLGGAVAALALRPIVGGLTDIEIPLAVAIATYAALVVGSACLTFLCSPFEKGHPAAIWPVAAGSVWFAPVVMFAAIAPAVAALAAVIAGISAATALARPSPPATSAPSRDQLLEQISGTRMSASYYRRFAGVVLAYTAAVLVILQLTTLGLVFIVVATAVLSWPSDRPMRPPSRRRLLFSASLGTGLVLIAAWPFHFGIPAGTSEGREGDDSPRPNAQTDGQYHSIILVPELPPELADVITRAPTFGNPARQARSRSSIPFSGVYWIFYGSRPGPQSFSKVGDPRTSRYHSIDSMRIKMEGRQQLQPPLDLRCCGGINVVLTTRDEPMLDEVALELILAHPSFEQHSLGAVWLESGLPRSEPTAHFSIPNEPLLNEADLLIVRFHLPESLGGRSPRAAIDRFDLLPRN